MRLNGPFCTESLPYPDTRQTRSLARLQNGLFKKSIYFGVVQPHLLELCHELRTTSYA
jgi:hypothetical protein